jgi:hypothetical protein
LARTEKDAPPPMLCQSIKPMQWRDNRALAVTRTDAGAYPGRPGYRYGTALAVERIAPYLLLAFNS